MEENSDLEEQEVIEPDEGIEDPQMPDDRPAAFTLVIQSWATPIIGIAMLIVGLFGGYYLRPVLTSTPTPVAAVEEVSAADTEVAPTTTPISDAERAAQQAELMTAVVERTRHFRGDPDAPITIIEFSDFL